MRAGKQEDRELNGQKREEAQDCRGVSFNITKISCFHEIFILLSQMGKMGKQLKGGV